MFQEWRKDKQIGQNDTGEMVMFCHLSDNDHFASNYFGESYIERDEDKMNSEAILQLLHTNYGSLSLLFPLLLPTLFLVHPFSSLGN